MVNIIKEESLKAMGGFFPLVKRRKNVLVLLILITIIATFTHLNEYQYNSFPILNTSSSQLKNYKLFFNDLKLLKPKTGSIKDKYNDGKAKELFVGNKEFVFTKKYLENVLNIPDQTFKELHESHTFFKDNTIPTLINEYGVKTFGNIVPESPEWSSYHNSNGYLFIGGGKYNWLSLLGIKYLRELGAKYPIEVFIATPEDYEEYYCNVVLPKYNAYCNVFPQSLMKSLIKDFKISGYQYKLLALLVSKFENVFYIDSDNIPVKNLDYLFTSEAYVQNKLILWPDAWARTTNPKYYDIANIKIGPKVRGDLSKSIEESNFHDYQSTLPNPTTETGMFMVNKSTHLKTLLLALYYNVFGPHYYYPLFTQGSAGEGDKETFIAAAHVMNQPWYQVQRKFTWIGYHEDGSYHSKCLGHYDLVSDYENYVMNDNKPFEYDNSEKWATPELIFMHASYPKYTPQLLVEKEQELVNKNGEHRRLYGKVIRDALDRDFELHIWEIFTNSLCEKYTGPLTQEKMIGLKLDFFKKDDKLAGYCDKYFIPRLNFLRETTVKE